MPHFHSSERSSEKHDDYIDIESNNPYENDFLNAKRTSSSSSTTSISSCSPLTQHQHQQQQQAHRSIPYTSSPNYSHEQRASKRSRSPSSTDDETSKRLCSTTSSRPTVKNDLRNIESLIERAPAKTSVHLESPPTPSTSTTTATMDPNYLYLFYMAQLHNHQKTPALHPQALQRYLFYNQQQIQNYYHYPSSSPMTNTK